jgi:hypothetical protein
MYERAHNFRYVNTHPGGRAAFAWHLYDVQFGGIVCSYVAVALTGGWLITPDPQGQVSNYWVAVGVGVVSAC